MRDITFIDLTKSYNITFYSHNGWVFKVMQAVSVVIWMELEPISLVCKSLGLFGLNYDFCNVVFLGPNHVPACKLSMILYYKAREPCMARVFSSTVQYVIACFTASYRIFSSWVHNTPRLQFKTECKKNHFGLWAFFVSHRVEISYIKSSRVSKYYSHVVTHGKTFV